jgi:hypothetical protein
MYCSSCGAAVAQGLSYCNFCGAKLGASEGAAVKSPEVKPELLASAMVAVFVLGLVAIAILVGVMKAVAGFDLPFLLAATVVSFAVMLLVEGVLIGLLLKGRRGSKEASGAGRPKEQTTKDLGEAEARALPEPVPSVTEHTTRTLEPVYGERQSK